MPLTPAQLEAIIGYADMEARRGNGCASIWISRKELRRLGPKTPEGISTDRLQGVSYALHIRDYVNKTR